MDHLDQQALQALKEAWADPTLRDELTEVLKQSASDPEERKRVTEQLEQYLSPKQNQKTSTTTTTTPSKSSPVNKKTNNTLTATSTTTTNPTPTKQSTPNKPQKLIEEISSSETKEELKNNNTNNSVITPKYRWLSNGQATDLLVLEVDVSAIHSASELDLEVGIDDLVLASHNLRSSADSKSGLASGTTTTNANTNTNTNIITTKEPQYLLHLDLPKKVDEDHTKAIFDKNKKLLRIEMSIKDKPLPFAGEISVSQSNLVQPPFTYRQTLDEVVVRVDLPDRFDSSSLKVVFFDNLVHVRFRATSQQFELTLIPFKSIASTRCTFNNSQSSNNIILRLPKSQPEMWAQLVSQ